MSKRKRIDTDPFRDYHCGDEYRDHFISLNGREPKWIRTRMDSAGTSYWARNPLHKGG